MRKRSTSLLFWFLVSSCSLWTLAGVTAQERPATVARLDLRPQVRYELGADSLPQPNVPRGQLVGPYLFHSDVIADTVRKIWIYVPAQYDANRETAVLVFQDGARATNPEGVLRVPQVLDNLIAQRRIPVTIGIFITPGQRGEVLPDSVGLGNPDNRDREYDVLDDRYARMVIDEILPWVGKSYRLTTDAAHRAIGGSSSGAICAFTVAWHRPDVFRNVISLIGSFTDIHGGHVYPDLILAADRKPIRIFLQDGEFDLRNPENPNRDWYLQNQKMIAAFQAKQYDMTFVIGQGGHSDDHGGAILPQMLSWIWRDHPDVAQTESTDWTAAASAIRPTNVDLFPGFNPHGEAKIEGRWTWKRSRGNDVYLESVLHIARIDDRLSGSIDSQVASGEKSNVPIENIETVGNKLTFNSTRLINGSPVTATYMAIVHADELVGWQIVDSRGSGRESSWRAVRIASDGSATHLSLPPTDDNLPGIGPIRRYDWFQDLWTNRRTEWKSQLARDQLSLVFFGDSITQGWGDDFQGLFPGVKLANRGISGDTTRGMLLRLRDDVLSLHPRGVVMLMGTNDLEEHAEPETIVKNIVQIIGDIKKHSATIPIVVCLVMPSSATKSRPADKIQQLNRLIAEATRGDHQVSIVDTWRLFANEQGDAKEAEFPDLLHPNAAGYQRWAAGLRPILETHDLIPVEVDAFEIEAGFEPLFNGRDLTGWCSRPSSEADKKAAVGWRAGDPNAPPWPIVTSRFDFDHLKSSPDGRYLARHGRLVVAIPPEGRKIQQLWTTREFGNDFELRLQFRASPNADSGVFIRGQQLQCRDYPIAGPYKELKSFKPYDWNDLQIIVHGTTAECRCNGELLEAAFAVPTSGPIGLEGDQGQLEYRRLRIQLH